MRVSGTTDDMAVGKRAHRIPLPLVLVASSPRRLYPAGSSCLSSTSSLFVFVPPHGCSREPIRMPIFHARHGCVGMQGKPGGPSGRACTGGCRPGIRIGGGRATGRWVASDACTYAVLVRGVGGPRRYPRRRVGERAKEKPRMPGAPGTGTRVRGWREAVKGAQRLGRSGSQYHGDDGANAWPATCVPSCDGYGTRERGETLVGTRGGAPGGWALAGAGKFRCFGLGRRAVESLGSPTSPDVSWVPVPLVHRGMKRPIVASPGQAKARPARPDARLRVDVCLA